MIEKLLQMKNARLILGLALSIIVLSVLYGLIPFEARTDIGEGIVAPCSAVWWPKYETGFLLNSHYCDFEASSRRYTILFVATTTFFVLAGGLLVFERLRKKA